MAKTKRAKLDRQGAVAAICAMGHGLEAIRALSVSQEEGSLKAAIVATCIDTMMPELLRNADQALAALDEAMMGGFSKA